MSCNAVKVGHRVSTRCTRFIRLKGWSSRMSRHFFLFHVNIFVLPRLCVLAVTLLDSMSALADLGWEAYPNEGVSIENAHTHTHRVCPCAGGIYLITTSGSHGIFSGAVQRLGASSRTRVCVWRAPGSWAFFAKSGVNRGNTQIISAPLQRQWHWSFHLLRDSIFGDGVKGQGIEGRWRDKYSHRSRRIERLVACALLCRTRTGVV